MLEQHNIETAVAAIRSGDSLRQVAARLGVSHTAIRKWLLSEKADEYQDARNLGLISRIVEADEMLESAQDAVSIARAREVAKFARWDAERRVSELFGNRQHIVVDDAESYRDVLKTVATVRQDRIRHVMSNANHATDSNGQLPAISAPTENMEGGGGV